MGSVPAACALGSPAGSPLCIYFLAARRPPKMIENPRQTSAYHYPPKFGRHSPVFSRACVWGDSRSSRLFVSGTASIVGHETIHRGDVTAQTRETLVNISALLAEANHMVGSARYSLEPCAQGLRRRPEDLPGPGDAVPRTAASAVFPKADIAARTCWSKSVPSVKPPSVRRSLLGLVRKSLVRIWRRRVRAAAGQRQFL